MKQGNVAVLVVAGLLGILSGCNCEHSPETEAGTDAGIDAGAIDGGSDAGQADAGDGAFDGGCVKAANKALRFSGSQYAVAPDSPSLHVTTDFTVEAWVSFAQPVAFECIVCKPYGTQTGDSFAIWYQSGGLYAGAAPTNTATGFGLLWSPVPDEWYHLAFTYENSSRHQRLYIDGQLAAEGTAPSQPQYDSHPFYIGADLNFEAGDGFFIGTIDEVRIWTSVRNIDEIGGDLRSCTPGSLVGLAAYFPLDEGVGQEAGDVSGNGNMAHLGASDAGESSDPTWVDSTVPF